MISIAAIDFGLDHPGARSDGLCGRAEGRAVGISRGHPTGVPEALAKASAVERGEYLATAADCIVCHTTQGGKEFAGGLGFKLPFGTLYSTNITPDKETGIGNYSDQDFLDALRASSPRRHALSGDVLHGLYLYDRRGCSCDQGLSFQSAGGACSPRQDA